MDWILDLKVPIFLALTFVVTIVACFIALYAFHASTKGNHFHEWKEFEPLDVPDSVSSYMRHERKTIFNLLHNYIKDKYNCSSLLDTDIENIMSLFNRHYSISSKSSKRNMEWEVLTKLIFNDANSDMDSIIKDYIKSLT